MSETAEKVGVGFGCATVLAAIFGFFYLCWYESVELPMNKYTTQFDSIRFNSSTCYVIEQNNRAVNVCIGNPAVNSMEILSKNVEIINNLPNDTMMTVTAEDLVNLGCVI